MDRYKRVGPVAFPFYLGTTSYVLPDFLLPNIEFLSENRLFRFAGQELRLGNIEILFFESHRVAPLPKADIIQKLAEYSRKYDITYTIHLPFDLSLGKQGLEQDNLDKLMTIWELTKELDVFSYILHCNMEKDIPLSRWLSSVEKTIGSFIDKSGLSSKLISIENLDYPFSSVFPVVKNLSTSICMDTGHLLMLSESPITFLGNYSSYIRVLHVHAVKNGKDHNAFKYFPDSFLSELLAESRSLWGVGNMPVMTVELFSWDKVNTSVIELMRVIAS